MAQINSASSRRFRRDFEAYITTAEGKRVEHGTPAYRKAVEDARKANEKRANDYRLSRDGQARRRK